uniref:Uncharacterized protein n=1 Tax=Lepeophtheirus salmonis TaxID=72036 RepID=A0A0K2UMN8_LEPSM
MTGCESTHIEFKRIISRDCVVH